MWPRRLLFAGALALSIGVVSAHAETITIVIQQIAYAPADTKATVGDTVDWTNKDIVPHTATARNGAWKVVIQPNRTAKIVLKKAGTFEYYCEFHPTMTGRLTVSSTPKK